MFLFQKGKIRRKRLRLTYFALGTEAMTAQPQKFLFWRLWGIAIPYRTLVFSSRRVHRAMPTPLGRWGGKTVSVSHFAFLLVLQCLGVPRYPDDGKTARKVSLSHHFLCAPDDSKNQDLRAVSPYASRQSAGNMTNRPLLPMCTPTTSFGVPCKLMLRPERSSRAS